MRGARSAWGAGSDQRLFAGLSEKAKKGKGMSSREGIAVWIILQEFEDDMGEFGHFFQKQQVGVDPKENRRPF